MARKSHQDSEYILRPSVLYQVETWRRISGKNINYRRNLYIVYEECLKNNQDLVNLIPVIKNQMSKESKERKWNLLLNYYDFIGKNSAIELLRNDAVTVPTLNAWLNINCTIYFCRFLQQPQFLRCLVVPFLLLQQQIKVTSKINAIIDTSITQIQ